MAVIHVVFDGGDGNTLLMHNERLADPIDPYTRWLAELTGKRKKTERDHEEIGRREFIGAGYWAVDEGVGKTHAEPIIPTWNIIRCLQAGATRFKLGKHVVRGIVPISEETPLLYDGPRDVDELWKSGLFHSRKGVGVGTSRVVRTRPAFTNWKIDVELELDLTILDPETVDYIAVSAGKYEGLGDGRPRFGRFHGSAVLVGDPADYIAPDLLDDVRSKLAALTQKQTITESDKRHAATHPNGPERAKRVRKRAEKA